VHAAGTAVHYRAGWNIVAAPTGTVLEQAARPFYAFGPASDGYQAVGGNDIVAGRAVWAFFAQDTDVTLGATPSQFTRLIVPSNHFAMIGNPSSTQTLPLSGSDTALSYDPTQARYVSVTELGPGQGAWVFRASAGDVTLGKTSGAMSDQVRQIQDALTRDAADPSSFGRIPALADSLLSAHDYQSVQSAMDDIRSAFNDGLLLEKAASLPEQSTVQHDASVAIREALAEAATASAGGDQATADAALDRARKRSVASVEDGAALARAGAGGSVASLAFAVAQTPGTVTPKSLALYGVLCFSAVPALALSVAPPPGFEALVGAVLNNNPLPPASTPANNPSQGQTNTTSLPLPAPTSPPVTCTGATITLLTASDVPALPITGITASGLDPSSPFNLFVGQMLYLSGTTDASGMASIGLTQISSLINQLAQIGASRVTVTIATSKKCGATTITLMANTNTPSNSSMPGPATPTPTPTPTPS
jgi:hypothetical protein